MKLNSEKAFYEAVIKTVRNVYERWNNEELLAVMGQNEKDEMSVKMLTWKDLKELNVRDLFEDHLISGSVVVFHPCKSFSPDQKAKEVAIAKSLIELEEEYGLHIDDYIVLYGDKAYSFAENEPLFKQAKGISYFGMKMQS